MTSHIVLSISWCVTLFSSGGGCVWRAFHEMELQTWGVDFSLSFLTNARWHWFAVYYEKGMWEVGSYGLEGNCGVPYKTTTLKYFIVLQQHPVNFICYIFAPVIMLVLLDSAVDILSRSKKKNWWRCWLRHHLVRRSDVADWRFTKTFQSTVLYITFLVLIVLVLALTFLMTISSLWVCHKGETSQMSIVYKESDIYLPLSASYV